jgi:SpoVK/Ycf46/Vps4 family AAA+-type ATPase
MIEQNRNEALIGISNIYNALENKKLASQAFKKVDAELKYLAKKIGGSKEEAFVFSLIFTLNLEDSSASYSSISKVLGCNVIELMTYSASFKTLVDKNLIIAKKERNRFKKTSQTFMISDEIQEAVINNEFPLKPVFPEIKNQVEVLEEVYNLLVQYDEEEITFYELVRKTDELLEKHEKFSLVKSVKALQLNVTDRAVLLYLLWKTLSGSETVYMSVALEGLMKNASKRVRYCQELISGKNELIRKDLIELEKAGFFNDSDMKLAGKGRELLEKEGIKLGEVDREDVMEAAKIKKKELFFNGAEKRAMDILGKTLEKKRFIEVQQHLKNRSLPLGVNCIFYGPPGTGKTEGVYQIARRTGRDIMKVDISETKSKWFGDSEKLIKKIFTRYKVLNNSSQTTPILLFNEADAILSIRTANSGSSIDQTLNTIQNILLEELENFQGIFIATTNLVNNLDTAFERRFLFKIEIQKPAPEARQKIWQSKLEFLSQERCLRLAEEFDFSGGEIENITRKILISEIVHAQRISFESILNICREEKFDRKAGSSIGFRI